MANNNNISKLKGANQANLLNLNAQRTLEKMGRGEWYQAMQEASQNTGGRVQPYEIFIAASRESNFNPKAKSKISTAAGLGQFVKDTAESVGLNNPYDPIQSIHAMGNYLGQLKKQIGTADPLATQQAYMLGGGGYKKAMRGDTSVKGYKDLQGLINKYKQDMSKLSEGSYDINSLMKQGRVTPEEVSGKMSVYQKPDKQPQLEIEEIVAPKKPTASTIGTLGGLGELEKLQSLGTINE